MAKRKDYVELLRSELKVIRKKLNDSTHGDHVYSIDRKKGPGNLLKHYEGMEYVVREVVKSLEMGRQVSEIEEALLVSEARFRKIIESQVEYKSNWQYYAKGGLEGAVIVRALIA